MFLQQNYQNQEDDDSKNAVTVKASTSQLNLRMKILHYFQQKLRIFRSFSSEMSKRIQKYV